MRRLFAIILAVTMLLAAGSLYANTLYVRSVDARLKDFTVIGGTKTLSTTCTSSNRVLGYTYSDSAAGSAALFDAANATTAASASTIFSEVYVAAGTSETVMFPLPRALTNGLVTDNTTTTGALTVYYE